VYVSLKFVLIERGYDPSKTVTNVYEFDEKRKVYSSPRVDVAKGYAHEITVDINGTPAPIIFVFQNRINPKEMQRAQTFDDGEYWGAGMDTMRPYGLLVKKCNCEI
jgi:hypothetical protein